MSESSGNHKHNQNPRNYFLSDIPLPRAINIQENMLKEIGFSDRKNTEMVPLNSASGRIVSQDIEARFSSPIYNTAAMDGVAINSLLSVGATESIPVILKSCGQYEWVDTGDALPDWTDSVVMVEDVEEIEDGNILLRSPVGPYQHVRREAEDFAAPELLLHAGSKISPRDLACLGASGIGEIPVIRRPKVAIIPTGNELIPSGHKPQPGQVIEFNSAVIAALCKDWGAEVDVLSPVSDVLDEIKDAIVCQADSSDIVLVLAGSSAGSEDFTSEAVQSVGSIAFHGVAIRPGHPILLGNVGSVPVMGIPGYPASAEITADLFLKPMLELFDSSVIETRESITAELTRRLSSSMGDDEFIKVTLGYIGERYVATPLSRGAAMTLSMSKADGLLTIPAAKEGFEKGEKVSIELLTSRTLIDKTVLMSGSDDIAIRLLEGEVQSQFPDIRLRNSSVGSVGGLIALADRSAQIAGSHLLDTETGKYNITASKRILSARDFKLVDFVGRTQGLIFRQENASNISGIQSISENNLNFINRQRGSGTRLFVDHLLASQGIDPLEIIGYEVEEYTHWAIAAAVLSGSADVGVGIYAAAQANALQFIPLGQERFQFVIPSEESDDIRVKAVISVLQSDGLKRSIEELGGYDVSLMGNIAYET